ncbi:3-oxoadipate enol-lactonase [Antrihabitans spumae]|uniref:3-oxoadipate enol-lactonase n=1 Tax=Antrihabitans spumae TaxID=3373370 RepID=A0ABW7KKN9_9NOCA
MSVELAYKLTDNSVDSPTIVLLGSLGSDRSMWNPQVAALSETHAVLTVDLRGHGESPTPTGPYTIQSLAADVIALVDKLELTSVDLVGLSLGGAIAQSIAVDHPDRVRTLTLICTAARFGVPQGWIDRAAAVRANGTGSIAAAVVGRWYTADYAAQHPDLTARSISMIENTDDDGYASCCEAIAGWDGRDDLARISAPTLVIAGEQDPATTPADLRIVSDAIPNSILHVLDPAAHLASVEQADRVNELITQHITTAART